MGTIGGRVEGIDSLYFYGRSRKRKLNYSTDSEEIPPLPPQMQALEIKLDDNDDYMPDCPSMQHDFDYCMFDLNCTPPN